MAQSEPLNWQPPGGSDGMDVCPFNAVSFGLKHLCFRVRGEGLQTPSGTFSFPQPHASWDPPLIRGLQSCEAGQCPLRPRTTAQKSVRI